MQSALERQCVKQYENPVPPAGKQMLPGAQSSYCDAVPGFEIMHWLRALPAPFAEQTVVPSPAMEHFCEHQSSQVPDWQTGSQAAPFAICGEQPSLGLAEHVLASGFGALLSFPSTGENWARTQASPERAIM
jgi:hypothetical protein